MSETDDSKVPIQEPAPSSVGCDEGAKKPKSESTSKRKQAEWFDIDEEHNTSIYVSGLPTSLTEDEFIELMKKCGIIAKKLTPGNPYNIKLYKNKDGSFKGDALCRFVRKESVELALTYLDDYQYDDKHVLKCERAKFECKGSFDPTKKPRVDPRTKIKQKKAVEKLLSWEPKLAPETKQKRVILKNMFTPQEIEEDPSLLLEIREDVESKCSELVAEPKRIDIYDKHSDGVIAVTFAEPHQAQACIDALNNNYYAQRVVTAELWDGKTKYKIHETDEESERRLKKWEQDIQKSDESGDDADEKNDVKNHAEHPKETRVTQALVDDPESNDDNE